MTKMPRRLGREEDYLNIIKVLNKKLTANIIMGKTSPLRSRTIEQRCSHLSLLFTTVHDFLARAIRHKKEIKDIQNGKMEKKN